MYAVSVQLHLAMYHSYHTIAIILIPVPLHHRICEKNYVCNIATSESI